MVVMRSRGLFCSPEIAAGGGGYGRTRVTIAQETKNIEKPHYVYCRFVLVVLLDTNPFFFFVM